jgi:hypothetical protein
MAVELVRHRFTTKEYYQMMDAGILTENDRVELIEGDESSWFSPRSLC